jgi:hypothetical protein
MGLITLARYDDSIPLVDLDVPRGEKWIEHLNAVYAIEFQLLNAAVQVGGIAAPIVLAVISNLPQHCSKNVASNCIVDAQLAAVPMAPALLVLFFGYLFFNSRIVGKYARNLERQIQGPHEAHTGIRLPALARLSGAVYGGETPKLRPLRAFYLFLALSVVALSLYTMSLAIIRIESPMVEACAIAFYSAIAVLAAIAYGLGASHQLYRRLAHAAGIRDVRRLTPPAPTLSWGRFTLRMILPRVPSLLKAQHGLTLLGAYLLMYYSTRATFEWDDLRRVIAGLLIFEIVLYQTRYLLNGSREEQDPLLMLPANRRNDPEVPFSAVQRVLIPIISLARCGLFVFLMTLWDISSAQFAVLVVILFFAAFYIYEIPREAARKALRTAVTRIAKLRPAQDADYELVRVTLEWGERGWILFLTVGAGYALRAFLALSLAPGYAQSLNPTGWLLVGVGWATGSAVVGVGWTAEFLGALSRTHDHPTVHRNILAKPHLLWAASHLGDLVPEYPWTLRLFSKDESRENDRLIVTEHIRRPQWAPWRLATCCAVALALGSAAIWPNRTSHHSSALYILLPIYLLMSYSGTGAKLFSWTTAGVAVGTCVLGSTGNPPLFILGVTTAVIYPLVHLSGAETGRLADLIARALAVQEWLDKLVPKFFKAAGTALEFLLGYAVVHPRRDTDLEVENIRIRNEGE